MAKFSKYEFKDFMYVAITHLTPKAQSNVNLILQATIEVNGQDYLMRAHAPNNYRKVFWKLHPEEIKTLLASDSGNWWAERTMGDWIKEADHDSCWNEGLKLSRLVNKVEEYHLKKIQILKVKEVNYQVDTLSEVYEEISSIEFSNLTYLDAVISLVKAFYLPTDELELEFRNEKNWKKVKKIRLVSSEKMEHGNTGKICSFSAEELKKYLRGEDYILDNYPNHRRSGLVSFY